VSILATLPKLVSRKWWLPTLVVIVGVYVLIQLGFWQLDRLQQRRDFNAMVVERWKQEPFDVNTNEIPADLSALEYRRVQATGTFDYENQILLKNQTRNQAPGSVVVTPLVLEDGRAVLVARGWLPSGEETPERWSQYNEPSDAPVIGLLQETQLLPNGTAPTPPATPQREWFQINIDAIQPQMPYELLPVFILQLPEDGRSYNQLPLREEPIVLDEGSHFSYAMQWFMFAIILGVGYIILVRTQELREQRIAGTLEDGSTPTMDGDTAVPSANPVQSNNAL
jgi:surfeit locus 1 family protein